LAEQPRKRREVQHALEEMNHMSWRKERVEPPKPRNPYARALAVGIFQPKVKPSGKVYRRKGRTRKEEG
jgi:hypothetical protein